MRRSSPTQSTRSRLRLMRLALSSLVCAGMLSACAVPQAPTVVECPPAPIVPASLVSDKSQNVADFLQRVQDFLKKAAAWSEGSTPTGQQSEKR